MERQETLFQNVYSEEIKRIVASEKKHYTAIKRAFDVGASLFAVIILSPLFLILSVWIFLDDPHGSPLFCQKRVGKDGKVFRFYKFRSMVANAEALQKDLMTENEKDGPVFKIKNDPRITKVGKFIRKTSLDELPQLLNILKGDMSIVGPRPPLPKEVAEYDDYQKQRLAVTPGLTCYWQVQKNRDDISFKDWVEMDLKYIKERNLFVDLKLIFQTVMVVFTGEGE